MAQPGARSYSEIPSNELRPHLFKPGDYHVVECDGTKLFFHADTLQIYEVQDAVLEEFIRVHESAGQTRVRTWLTPANISDIHQRFLETIRNNPRPKPAEYREKFDTIVLMIAEDCNLQCLYCFAKEGRVRGTQVLMSFAQAKSALEFMLKENPSAEHYAIIFFGGEPLLNFPVIRSIIDYAEGRMVKGLGKQVAYSLTTNGTILNQEIFDTFVNYHFQVVVSLDGPAYWHDKVRPFRNGGGSFNKVIKNIEKFKSVPMPNPFMVRATITPLFLDFIALAEFFESLALAGGFALDIVEYTTHKLRDPRYTDWTTASLEEFTTRYRQLMEFYLARILNKLPVTFGNLYVALGRLQYRITKTYSCAAGRALSAVTTDGGLYSCQNLCGLEEAKIGTLKDGFYPERRQELRPFDILDAPPCAACWARFLCGGGCTAEAFVVNQDVRKPLAHRCQVRRLQWLNHIWLYQKLRRTAPKFLEQLPVPMTV